MQSWLEAGHRELRGSLPLASRRDNNGNQTGRGADTFAWDHENRLTSATVSGTQTTYTYNGDGLRQTRASGGNTTSYTWDVVGLPKLLQDGTNTYVYGIGLISTTDGSGNQTYPQHDGLGSTVALANGSGAITGTYSYDVFGAVRSHTGGSTEFGFTGEQNDPNGLEYLRARYYDPATGRFLGRDPLGQGYGYAGANPVNRVDPTGLYWIACPGDDQCIWSEDVGLPVDPPVDCSEPGGYGYCIWADGEIFIAGGPSMCSKARVTLAMVLRVI